MATLTDPRWAQFSGLNAAYLLDLYERFRDDPSLVDPEARALFERYGAPPVSTNGAVAPATAPPTSAPPAVDALTISGATRLAMAIRSYGHRAAQLDPLASPPPGDAALAPEAHGIREADLASLPASVVGGPAAADAGNALAAVRALRRTYQNTTGYEFQHVSNADERRWLRDAVESGAFRPPREPIDEQQILQRLTDVGSFERFLGRAFPSQTRFSLEGLGMMVPILDEVIGAAAEAGTRSVIIGMAHRGRLNVMAHILGKSYEQIIGEFMGHYRRSGIAASDASDEGWTGDVKYHLGARRAYRGGAAVGMIVSIAPNPSHLEYVNPVVEGMCRAHGERRGERGPAAQDELSSLAVLIHGDAAFPGEGIVAETLNLSRLPGYRTGGTIHLIVNNQLGFTTPPEHGRSTLFASDLAKGFEIPIVHVNADDAEACIAAARLAHAYRERFRKDVLIDLIGYRRLGHNEGDEPSFTQPRMYAGIPQHPTVRELWAQEMIRRGSITRAEADTMLQDAIERLHGIRRALQQQALRDEHVHSSGREAGGETGGVGTPAPDVPTAVAAERLAVLNDQLLAVPNGFHLHPKLERPFSRRRVAFAPQTPDADRKLDWAHAETLAFASILADGTPIRLTGQDVERGTFSQRHLVLHDAQTGAPYAPLQAIADARASFEVWNSPLSESAALGFEFGYDVAAPDALVLWEAQYGDFVNSAQVIVDQFITSAKSKWEQTPSLVLLLPHAYEGQGPEHSSARLERFLQQAAEDNLWIAYPSTPAQYFHLLRRQARLLRIDPRPLVVMSPKSLLRNPLAASTPEELTTDTFQPVIDDPAARQRTDRIRRLVLCSGKVYFDVAASGYLAGGPAVKDRQPADAVAVARVEELYPLPVDGIAGIIGAYPGLEEVVWLQEEPRNMGAWLYVAPRLRDILGARLPLVYVGRTRRASPSEGSHEWHVHEQVRLVEDAFRFGPAVDQQTTVEG